MEVEYTEAARAIVGILFLLIGIPILTIGRRFYKVLLFLNGAWCAAIICYEIVDLFSVMVFSETSDVHQAVAIAAIGMIALLSGYIAMRWSKIGLFSIGLSFGASIGFLIMSTHIIENTTASMGLVLSFALIGAILIIIFKKNEIIIATSVLGSEYIFSGIGQFAGTGYISLGEDSVSSTDADPEKVVWAILGCQIALSIFAMAAQFVFCNREKDCRPDQENEIESNDEVKHTPD